MGLRMTGNADYASVPNNSLFQFGAAQDFTIELRMKTAGWSGDPSFVGNKDWISGFNNGFIRRYISVLPIQICVYSENLPSCNPTNLAYNEEHILFNAK